MQRGATVSSHLSVILFEFNGLEIPIHTKCQRIVVYIKTEIAI